MSQKTIDMFLPEEREMNADKKNYKHTQFLSANVR